MGIIGADGIRVPRDPVADLEFQFIDPINIFHPFLLADAPCCGEGRELTPGMIGAEFGGAVTAETGRQVIAVVIIVGGSGQKRDQFVFLLIGLDDIQGAVTRLKRIILQHVYLEAFTRCGITIIFIIIVFINAGGRNIVFAEAAQIIQVKVPPIRVVIRTVLDSLVKPAQTGNHRLVIVVLAVQSADSARDTGFEAFDDLIVRRSRILFQVVGGFPQFIFLQPDGIEIVVIVQRRQLSVGV